MPKNFPKTSYNLIFKNIYYCFLLIFIICLCSPRQFKNTTTNNTKSLYINSKNTELDTIKEDTLLEKYEYSDYTIPYIPECSEIEFLISSAENACLSYKYEEANEFLQKALALLKQKKEYENALLQTDSLYSHAVRIYTEYMPKKYLNKIPEEISMLLFQKQMEKMFDTIKISKQESMLLNKISCQKEITYNFPITFNEKVYKCLYFFTQTEKDFFNNLLKRVNLYLPFFEKILADSQIPSDISYLPIIESGYNPLAYSGKHAAGIWQFIASTAANYNLTINYWIDERRDPIKSTMAAASYLKKLYSMFNDWHLAIAAYNCGENTLIKALADSYDKNFWNLMLPNETRNYVPQFISALIIAKKPKCFGYESIKPAIEFDTITVKECINLIELSQSLNISYEELKQLNPHILHFCTLPDKYKKSMILYLPKNKKELFLKQKSNDSTAFRVTWYKYVCKSNQTLISIAKQFKVSVEALASLNKFFPTETIKQGNVVLIPIPVIAKNKNTNINTVLLEKEQKSNLSSEKKIIYYTIAEDDNLEKISKLFDISIKEICEINNIKQNKDLIKGQTIKLYIKKKNNYQEQKTNISKTLLQTQRNNKQVYNVKEGETLYSISKKLKIPLTELAEINGIDPQNPIIFAGQNLYYYNVKNQKNFINHKLPDTIFYKVCKGDNLYSISRDFYVEIKELTRINNISENTILKEGTILKIPYKEVKR